MNTQEKQEINTKIEELKKTISELEAKVNGPEEQPWIPHGNYPVLDLHLVDYKIGTSCNCFITKEDACYAAAKLKPIFTLLSYVTEFDKDEYGNKEYSIVYTWEGYWAFTKMSRYARTLGILMSKQCAEDLVDKLNKGLVKLD